jgi:hypothetical protein
MFQLFYFSISYALLSTQSLPLRFWLLFMSYIDIYFLRKLRWSVTNVVTREAANEIHSPEFEFESIRPSKARRII